MVRPAIGSNVFNYTGDCNIYVPTIINYKETTAWNSLSNRIKPLCTHANYDHINILHEAQSATCESIGWNNYEDCNYGCDYSTKEVISALDHSFIWQETTLSTCETNGEETEICSICETLGTTRPITALEHNWSEWLTTKAATCTEAGEETRTCQHNAEHTEMQDIPIAIYAHALQQHKEQSATCLLDGWFAYETCSNDGCGHTTKELIEALGHLFGDTWSVVIEPTETELGKEERICEIDGCEEKEERDIAMLDPTAIINTPKSGNNYGIRFAQNIVSDKAEISVVLPNNERATQTNITVYDMTGNVIFVGVTALGRPLTWDLRNSAGRTVSNGTYLVIAEVKGLNGMSYHYSAKLGVNK